MAYTRLSYAASASSAGAAPRGGFGGGHLGPLRPNPRRELARRVLRALEPLPAEQVQVLLEGGRPVHVAGEVIGHRRRHAAGVDVGGVLREVIEVEIGRAHV